MEVISKPFAGTTRSGRCGCRCVTTDSYAYAMNTGYAYYGCDATCYSGDDTGRNSNWNIAVNDT